MTSYKTFADALTAVPQPKARKRVAGNDNKRKESRYRGTLPALRWLYETHPDFAEPVAIAVKELSASNWNSEAGDDYLEIRPTIAELTRAASNPDSPQKADGKPNWLEPTPGRDRDGNPYIRLGALRFVRGALVEYGRTRKDRKLEPRDATRPRGDASASSRDPSRYLNGKPAASPLHAEPYQRPISTASAIPPMYDPQRDVKANRALLIELGVDGGVAFEDLPFPATRAPTVTAKGAEFLGGVVGLSGTASSGAVNMGDVPAKQKGEVLLVVEAIAAGATLTEIGERLGLKGVRLDRMAKDAIVEAGRVLKAANENNRKNIAA